MDLLNFLVTIQCKVSRDKLQFVQEKVIFLGHCLSAGQRHLSPNRVQTVQQAKLPTNVKQLRAFLGLISYCRQWIPNAAKLMQPLYDCTKQVPFNLSAEAETAFCTLKQELLRAPALSLPNYEHPFFLFVREIDGYALGVLTQKYDGKHKPLGYYSIKLDPVVKAAPTCLRTVVSVQAIVDKASDVSLDYPTTILTTHDVYAILTQVQTKHLSMARQVRMQCALLLPPNFIFQKLTSLNLAELLIFTDLERGDKDSENKDSENGEETFEIMEHDCAELIEAESQPVHNISRIPLPNPVHEFFIDGSRFADEHGKFHTGYAVVTLHETVVYGPLPPGCSAQVAELTALKKAIEQAGDDATNIYTDSAYAHGVIHDSGHIWAVRGFLTAAGNPIKHGTLIKELIEAAAQTKDLAVIKVTAHTRADTKEARGNDLADKAAKKAALLALEPEEEVNTVIDQKVSQQITQSLTDEELEECTKKGVLVDGVWHIEGLQVLPKAWFPILYSALHLPSHVSANVMMQQGRQSWYAPGFRHYVNERLRGCHICQINNPGQVVKVPQKHLPKAYYPFQRLQIDYIQMPRSGPYEYVLVCVDLFSGWPEAYPVKSATARNTAAKIAMELVPRFGLPEVIESDRGTHFTGQVFQNVCQALGIDSALHTPYRPQASGKVERLNGTLKLKIQKTMQETNKPWPQCLPIALYSVRTAPQGKTKLSPYNILFGRAPPLGCYLPQQLEMNCDNLSAYVISLQKQLNNNHARVFSSLPDPEADTGAHKLQPGDFVYVKKHTRKSLEPRFDGPFQVLLTTPTSVKLEGKETWIHASHCKLAS